MTLNEAETRAEFIDPKLAEAGWGVVTDSRIRREYCIAPGRIEGPGIKPHSVTADYVLEYKNTKLAVVEAKAYDEPLTLGVAQAKDYADKLQLCYTYSTSGRGIYAIDMKTGKEGEVSEYPSPDQLWSDTFPDRNEWWERFAAVPFHERNGSHPGRYYQDLAVERVLQAIAADRQRILLTLATGTGKTLIAFQIAWKLSEAKWNLSRQPTRRPRILFLADRNILADQAYNEFSVFDNGRARITPAEIRKKGRVPTNAHVFFTIFQTFTSGTDEGEAATEEDLKHGPYYEDYPPDFFDFIIIDECHRGGAQDESTWRAILDYFEPAVKLGLTATPKRTDNVDTYAYFGDPVFTYSLKDGINDGYLTPFKLKQFSTTLDQYRYTPDDHVLAGIPDPAKLYGHDQFNRTIEILAREVYRVKLLLDDMDPMEKTIIFCASQEHALLIRDLINQLSPVQDPNYCHRVTADDGKLGEQWLRAFQDNEKLIPTILTTSEKLATGVDARNIRNIVLMRPINSMIEFKQIIGRGTRLYDEKYYFTIYDFVHAHENFNDPEWDGEPVAPEPNDDKPKKKRGPDDGPQVGDEPKEYVPREKIVIILADGKERQIQHTMQTSFWDPSGVPMSARQFLERLFGQVPDFFKDEAELRAIWSNPTTRKKLLGELAEAGFDEERLREMQKVIDAENSDIFDVLAYVAYALPTRTREERATQARANLTTYEAKLAAFLEFVLGKYVRDGVNELDSEKLTPLLELRYASLPDAIKALGGNPDDIRNAYIAFQQYLYLDPP